MSAAIATRVALAMSAALLAGCPVKPNRYPGVTVTPKSETAALTGTTVVHAICPTGKRIGGGFVAPVAKGMIVRGSYPDDSNGWIVEADNTAAATNEVVTAYAYCLLTPDATVAVHRQGNAVRLGQVPSTSLRVNCPAGTTVTGGGFRIDGPLNGTIDAPYNAGLMESSPSADGWKLSIGQWFGEGLRLYAAYAVCASSSIQGGSVVEASYVVDPTQGGQFFSFSAKCPDPGTFTTAGGFRFSAGNDQMHRTIASSATGGFANWELQLEDINFANKPPIAIALCLPVP